MDLLLGRCWVSCIDLNLNTHARVYTMAKESGQAPVQRSHKLHTALLEKDENQNGFSDLRRAHWPLTWSYHAIYKTLLYTTSKF